VTYTVLGHCERTGRLGIGIATYSIAVGGLCPAIASQRGVLTSQAFVNPELRALGGKLIADGHPAANVIELLKPADANIEFRQLGTVDAYGRAAAHTGQRTRAWSGHRIGPHHVALGNVLAGEQVVAAMSVVFDAAADAPLAERLLRALEAGRDAGGQVGSKGHLPERSAALLVHDRSPIAELDLRVDLHDEAVGELRRIYTEYEPYLAFHRLRHIDPGKAPPQEVFVAELAARRGR
jgi:uncharacterized Ntn-hydrolase superfamily protein